MPTVGRRLVSPTGKHKEQEMPTVGTRNAYSGHDLLEVRPRGARPSRARVAMLARERYERELADARAFVAHRPSSSLASSEFLLSLS
eukprot:scaffold141807_cov32-Tisochrysis_lutea.AAC.8